MNIMFIGVITEEVMSNIRADELVSSLIDVNDAAEEVGRICDAYRSTKVDLTVLLTHIGFEEDKKLAALLDPAWGVDVIIGGHSHTELEQPEVVNDILIVQAAVGTRQIGHFDLVVDTVLDTVHEYEWKLVPITDENCPRDEALERLVYAYKEQTDRKFNRLLYRMDHELTHPSRYQDTGLGNLFADALKTDLSALAAEQFAGLRPHCCANLPYSVTTPVLTALLKPRAFDSITVMIQREVARRICAKPGTSEYGAFTVFCNWHAVPEPLFDVPPDCFLPRPKVTSTVLRLKTLKTPPVAVRDEAFFFRVVRAAFNQRRKTLENALSNGLGGIPKAEIGAAIAGLGLEPRVRGEELSFREFAALADRLKF